MWNKRKSSPRFVGWWNIRVENTVSISYSIVKSKSSSLIKFCESFMLKEKRIKGIWLRNQKRESKQQKINEKVKTNSLSNSQPNNFREPKSRTMLC